MAVTILVPTVLRSFTDRKSQVEVEGGTVGDVISAFVADYPDIKHHLYEDNGELRPYVNLYVGETNIKNLQGTATPLKDGDTVMLVPAIAGGGARESWCPVE